MASLFDLDLSIVPEEGQVHHKVIIDRAKRLRYIIQNWLSPPSLPPHAPLKKSHISSYSSSTWSCHNRFIFPFIRLLIAGL